MLKRILKMKDKVKLETIYEDQGHNGERRVIVPIVHDPDTGNEYDVADIYEMENDVDVYHPKQFKEKAQL